MDNVFPVIRTERFEKELSAFSSELVEEFVAAAELLLSHRPHIGRRADAERPYILVLASCAQVAWLPQLLIYYAWEGEDIVLLSIRQREGST